MGRRGQLLQAQGQVCLLYDLQDHADIELLPTDYARQCGCREAEVRPSTRRLCYGLTSMCYILFVARSFPKGSTRDGPLLSN